MLLPKAPTKTHRMVKQPARNMSDDEDDGVRILGFTEHEVELVLMSVQCIKPSQRYAVGWEVSHDPQPELEKRATEFLTLTTRRLV